MRIVTEGPDAHTEAIAAWDANEPATILSVAKQESPAFTDQLAAYDGPPALITWTSGTTGIPKGVVIPWSVMQARCEAEFAAFGGSDVLGVTMSLFQQGTWKIMAARMGCTVVAAPDGTEAMAAAIQNEGITCLFASPRNIRALLPYINHPPSLKRVISAGEPLDAQLRTNARIAFGCPVIDCYGTTEAGVIALNDGSGFKPVPGVGMRDVGGAVEIATPCLAHGTIAGPLPCNDDWHVTGDVGRFIGGVLTLKGRPKRG
jgi:long-chain acyl-CoA synthetase